MVLLYTYSLLAAVVFFAGALYHHYIGVRARGAMERRPGLDVSALASVLASWLAIAVSSASSAVARPWRIERVATIQPKPADA
jgi:hypothetical protein